ncbi:outer membrane beta-barrel protein [Leptolyngbya sp. FACHB-541]|uniref:outer membrane beta-barrel protein n=1 Tax=Leptolyngbya sp. FACHB-541 TaxID=2692810 RepID=UPI001681F3C4|nr:outer membrane beta-barrel protein [Leptolyngbya sp. FACHB-541]
MFLRLSRIWREFNAPQTSISANRKAPTYQHKQSAPLDFNLLKLPIFWIAFVSNSAAYAAPKTASPDSLITPHAEGQLPSRQIAVDKAIANPKVESLQMPFMGQVAPPEMLTPSRVERLETEAFVSEENSEVNTTGASDPELGILRLREQELQQTVPAEPDSAPTDEQELQQTVPTEPNSVPTDEQVDESEGDEELGILRLREQELEQIETQSDSPSAETIFFIGRLSYFKSDNILLDRLDPIEDELISLSATLLAAPSLGPDTLLLASVEGGLVHYNELSELDYRELEFRASLRQFLSARTYGEIGWSNQQLFDDGDRFFNDHSLRLTLARRDPLASDLRLDSFYQLRLGFADPSDRSRITNTVGVGLNYNLQPDLQVGLDYQLTLTNFTQQDREDLYNQVVAQLSYDLSRNSRIILFGGVSFGDSSDSDVDFNSAIFGASIDVNVPLF